MGLLHSRAVPGSLICLGCPDLERDCLPQRVPGGLPESETPHFCWLGFPGPIFFFKEYESKPCSILFLKRLCFGVFSDVGPHPVELRGSSCLMLLVNSSSAEAGPRAPACTQTFKLSPDTKLFVSLFIFYLGGISGSAQDLFLVLCSEVTCRRDRESIIWDAGD